MAGPCFVLATFRSFVLFYVSLTAFILTFCAIISYVLTAFVLTYCERKSYVMTAFVLTFFQDDICISNYESDEINVTDGR